MEPKLKTKRRATPAGLSGIQNWIDEGGRISLNAMRPQIGIHQNAILEPNEWAIIDTAVLDVVRTGLVGITDLVNAGLTQDVGGLGTILSGYEQLGDMTAADVSIDGTTAGEEDDVENSTVFVPIPIIHKDFRLSLRKLLASRNQGEGLDLTQVRVATRIVRDKMEDMLFNGVTKKLGGYSIYGYTNAPHIITDTAVGDFGTPGNGFKTMVKTLGLLSALGFNGPFMVYVANTQYNELLNLLGSNDRNELSLIREGLPQILDVKPSFNLTAGTLVFVQMTSDVVDLAVAEDITPIQWETMGGMQLHFRVMTALAPRIKADINNSCGVAKITGC